MEDMFEPDTLTWTQVLIRFAAASLLPLLIGLERFIRRKPVDFRPFVIISVCSCGLIIASVELLEQLTDPDTQIDPLRAVEGVITGIGFLGAGAMFRHGNFVQGAGSAAAIWSAGAIGLASGMGEIWLAAVVTGIVLLLLLVSAPFTEEWDPDTSDEREQQGGPPS